MLVKERGSRECRVEILRCWWKKGGGMDFRGGVWNKGGDRDGRVVILRC